MRRDVLLLQGPIGPFFSRLGDELEERGFRIHKVNLNGGDKFFYRRKDALDYSGTLDQWDAYLERLIVNNGIGRIYLFGDCRVYHRVAKAVARRLDVRLFVFEEGYIRPNFVTLEEGGVNGHSPMLREKPKSFSVPDEIPTELSATRSFFALSAIFSMLYYWASSFHKRRFPHYQHHRAFQWLPEGWRWVVSGVRKVRYKRRERHVLGELLPQFANNYFVCPLQVHCDMQVVVHSDYNSIEHFIGDVLTSFARYAPSNKAIVFKHHPMDRAYTNYQTLLTNLVSELGLQGRVYYVHDVDLPTLLKQAQGTVLINSTVGLSSLFHGTPVKTLGKAVYDIPELTSQLSLKAFWRSRQTVDEDTFVAFRSMLIHRNQLNGSLYRPFASGSPTGLVWSEQLEAEHTWSPDRIDVGTGRRLRVVGGKDVSTESPWSDDDAKAA